MKIKHRLFLTLLTLSLLCLLLLAACNGEKQNGADTTGEEKTSATDAGQTTGADTETTADTSESTKDEETTTMEETTKILTGVDGYDKIMNDMDHFPIRFTYGDETYEGFAGFEIVRQDKKKLDNGTEITTVLRNAAINADFRLVSNVYPDENAYEYVVYIENTSKENTKVFKDIEFVTTFEGEGPYLSGLQGDGGVSWYKEYSQDFSRKKTVSFKSTSGRPSHHVFPYFNFSYGSDDRTSGTFIAVGWSGTWHASFRVSGNKTVFSAGQNDVATYIAPGETFRTPLMAFVDYKNTGVDEQANVWRHYFMKDVMHKINGELPQTMAGFGGMSDGTTTDKMMLMLNLYKKNNIKADTLWMDAGWYTGASGERVSWPSTGTLNIDKDRFPDELSSIGKYCKDNNMKYLLWFEPEDIRLDKETFLKNTPGFKEEWLLDKTMVGTWLEGYLLDLGNPEARDWLIGKVSYVIETAGISIYRQDFNSDPAGSWAKKDGENRKGMTENQYVQGYLAYWDALLEKYPYLMIDSCASGGGRNDLETMKRSVPLHYSDLFDGSGDANNLEKTRITQSLFAWFPYFKNESYSVSLFTTRINYAPYSMLKMPSVMDRNADWAGLRKAYDEYAQIKGYFYNEYYRLTPYSEATDRWNGWEFFDPAQNTGYAQLICNAGCTTLTGTFRLKGLDADKTYTVKDFDGLVDITATGKDLMENGITITVPEAPYSVILLIRGK